MSRHLVRRDRDDSPAGEGRFFCATPAWEWRSAAELDGDDVLRMGDEERAVALAALAALGLRLEGREIVEDVGEDEGGDEDGRVAA